MQSISGVNGTLELYPDRIVLKRGKLLGNFEKTTYLKDIIEVKLKKPGLSRGSLSIATATDNGRVSANSVEANAIALKSSQWDEAVEFKRLIEDAASRAKAAGGGSHSAAEEIANFKRLMDEGVITPEEFSAKKKQLLGI